MRRIVVAGLLGAALAAIPATASAAQKTGCSDEASGWHLIDIATAAADFYPHLLPGSYASPADFAADIDAGVDKNDDDMVCLKLSWGYELNPNSHWYRLGFDLGLGEPVHLLTVLDNHRGAS